MAILGGLFSKKSKPRTPNGSPHTGDSLSPQNSSAASELESSLSCTSVSPTTEYVSPAKSLPSSPNGKRAAPGNLYPTAAASSSKLRLPFSRKKTSSASSLVPQDTMSPPRPSYASRTSTIDSSDTETSATERRHLRPPPSRSAIFAAYGGDPRIVQQSTRSLPDARMHKPDPPSPPLPPIPQQKRSLFNWYKSQPKSEPKVITSTQRPDMSPTSPDDSFNLKSFRHVRPGSPTHSNVSNTSLSNLPPPRPRPRGTSTASDSSQRISVAAFREAQARRSQAGSPAPSLRSQSPQVLPITGSKSYGGNDTNRSSSNLSHYYMPTQPQQNKLNTRGSSVFADDSDTTATSSEEAESDDEGDQRSGGNSAVGRRRTLTQRSSNKAMAGKARATRSEMGHGSSRNGDKADNSLLRPPPSTLAPPRQRASMSTSASMPNAAAKRASVLASNGEMPLPAVSSRHVRDSSVHTISASRPAPVSLDSDSDSDTDSDDAPLATLVPPRRPGSAMSNASGSRSNHSSSHTVSRPAPLIDIKTLTTKKPDEPFTVPRSKSTDVAFTSGPTLISASRSGTSPNQPRADLKRGGKDGPTPPSFVLPPLELDDQSSRLVSSPTSMFSSASNGTSTSTKPGSAPSDNMSARAFPRRIGSKDSTSTSSRGESISAPVVGKSAINDASPPAQERRREGLNDRLTKVVQHADISSNSAPKDNSTPPRHLRRASFDVISSSPSAIRENEIDYFSGGGGGIRLVGGGGENGVVKGKDEESPEEVHIAPIVIKQRAPPSSFAVTSRPPNRNSGSSDTTRQRSSTLLPSNSPAPFSTNKASTGSPNASPGATSSFNLSTNPNNNPTSGRSSPLTPPGTRQRSSTMMPLVTGSPNVSMFPAPTKPFAKRTESPASSTGDSSSGRAPLTPRDGSEVGSSSAATSSVRREGGKKEEWGSGVSGLALNGGKGKGHTKRQSVTFDDQSDLGGGKGGKSGKEKTSESPQHDEQRRKERRRSEAKAAIELGNVINGRGPIMDDDDDDEDQPINQAYGGRMGVMNPMMTSPGMSMPMGMSPMGPGSPSWNNMAGWQQGPLMPGQFMPPPPPPSDPNFLAAHQQAMMIAKQAYQMAVAQQAMAAAAEEWERSSSIGGFGGGGSVYGGSVYGGGAPNMGMGMGGWGGGGMMFPPGPRSMYGGGVAQSEYGGGGAGSGWGSKSVYGESFGPSAKEGRRVSRGNLLQMKQAYGQRDSVYSMAPSQPQSSSSTPHGTSRPRTTSTPASPGRAGGLRKAPPPSSWKAGV